MDGGLQHLAGLVGPRVRVVRQDQVPDLNLGDRLRGSVTHDHRGVRSETGPPGHAVQLVRDSGAAPAAQSARARTAQRVGRQPAHRVRAIAGQIGQATGYTALGGA